MTEPINSTISPWFPDQDQIRLATLGKLIEELNECSARAARCIIQGLQEVDPDTGRTNHEELCREVSDVKACIDMAYDVLGITSIYDRHESKRAGFKRWHRMINGGAG